MADTTAVKKDTAKKEPVKKTPVKKVVKKKTTTKAKSTAKTKKGNLVIVESPAKAKTIEKFLGKGYIVRASNGHLRDLPKSKMGIDIENNFEPDYKPIRGKAKLIKALKDDAAKSVKVYLATDPDREGEAISWHIAQMLDINTDDSCRIEFNEITKEAVTNAIENPRKIDLKRVDAQQARRILDRIVGYKLSPLLWRKVKKGLSAGRVQSVAVRVIVDREKEIRAFIPEEFWTISALLLKDKSEFEARYYGFNGKKSDKLTNKEQTDKVLEAITNAKFVIKDIKTGNMNKNALPPFTTSFLQQAASSKLGFTAKKTMMLAQMLYEGVPLVGGQTVGLITYMRTDSTRISSEAQSNAISFITEKYGADYVPKKPNVYKSKKNSQDAHEAIRPSYITNTPESIKEYLTPDQFKLYKLIYTRFLASQMTSTLYEKVAFDIDANSHIFKASGSRILFKGHLAVYDSKSDDDEQKLLPKAEIGDELNVKEIIPKQNFTQPPQRYTEASLIKFLEEKGIGRPSTYAPTISTIQDRLYVSKEGKSFIPSELGEIVNDLMCNNFSDIIDIQFTSDMEEKLDNVEQAEANWKSLIAEFYAPFEKDLEKAEINIEHVVLAEKVSEIVCEKCGALLVYKSGRFGEFLACPKYPECKNTKAIVKEIDVPCPKCNGKIVEKKGGKSKKTFYGCENYPNCDFVSWDMPLEKKCEVCGSYMTINRYKQEKCSNENCTTRKKADDKKKG